MSLTSYIQNLHTYNYPRSYFLDYNYIKSYINSGKVSSNLVNEIHYTISTIDDNNVTRNGIFYKHFRNMYALDISASYPEIKEKDVIDIFEYMYKNLF